MTTHVNTPEKAHKLSELIEYYEVCNRAEGKSPKTISWYSANLSSLQVKLIKIGGRIVRHARQIIFQLAEVAVPRDIFAAILERITRLCLSHG